jgi:hypothetical protein
MTLSSDPNERFLANYHPEILAARSKPHAFVPFPGETGDHVCTASCTCTACWEPKGDRKMHPKRLA